MTVQIIEVIRRSDQGLTRPFICRGDDDEVYFVKGLDAGRRSLICEWIAGRLGVALGLPIAPFEIVDVPMELLHTGGGLDLADLGPGPAFGSRRREAMELNAATIELIPVDVQRDVLAFDWWIKNPDRYLTERGGNPNLFWDSSEGELVVIDHNQAFAPDFEPETFRELHVFAHQGDSVFRDFARRREYNQRFSAALEDWERIQGSLPEEWHYVDPEMTIPVDFDLDAAFQGLHGFKDPDFWECS